MGRLIEADAMLEYLNLMYDEQHSWRDDYNVGVLGAINYIKHKAPTIDAVEVVRCYECKHRAYCYSEVVMTNKSQTADIYKSVNFCSYGERKEND